MKRNNKTLTNQNNPNNVKGVRVQFPASPITLPISFGLSSKGWVVDLLKIVQEKELSKNKLIKLRVGISQIIKSRFADVKRFNVPADEKTFSDVKELNSFLAAVSNPLYKLLFKILAWTGIRPCEAFRIRLKDFDFKNEDVYVRVSKNFDNFIKIPLPSKLCAEIKVLISYGLKDYPLKQCTNEYRQVFRKVCDKLGSKFVKTYADSSTGQPLFFFRPYSFRYFYQSLVANHSDLVGRALHNTPSVATKHYLTKIERIRQIVNELY